MIRPTAVQAGDLGVAVRRLLRRLDLDRRGRIELPVGVAIFLIVLVAPALALQPPLATSLGALIGLSGGYLRGATDVILVRLVVEVLFQYSGIGHLLLELVEQRDLPMVQGAATLIGICTSL